MLSKCERVHVCAECMCVHTCVPSVVCICVGTCVKCVCMCVHTYGDYGGKLAEKGVTSYLSPQN